MRVTLIKPNMGTLAHGPYRDTGRMEPLNIGVLAAMVPPDVEVSFYDDRCEPVDYHAPTDLVALTVETFTAKRSYEIAREYRSRGIPVVMGGMHPTLIPDEVRRHCDSVYIGDAEWGWSTVIEDARNHTLKPQYKAKRRKVASPQSTGPARRDLFAGKGYLPVSLLQFSRGCPHSCSFCATARYFSSSHFCRSTESVLDEVSRCGKLLFFVDDNFTADRPRARALLQRLKQYKVHWVTQVSIDVADDSALLKLMRESGCLGFVCGFESIVYSNLKSMNKYTNTHNFSHYEDQITALKDHGFQIWAAFTIGHDFDTVSSIEDTVAWAIKNKFAFAAFNILLPYPGTPLYRRIAEENRHLYEGAWWLHDDYRFNHAAIKPKHMTADRLTETCQSARQKFNSPVSIAKRLFDTRTNMRSIFRVGLFLRYSLLFRTEVYTKHGMHLGNGKDTQ